MEAANSTRPLPHFDYLPVHEGEPPTGRSEYHLPVIRSTGGKRLDQTEAVGLYGASRMMRSHGTHRSPHTGGNFQVSDCFYGLCNTFQANHLA